MRYSQDTPPKHPSSSFYAGPNLNYRYGEADPFQSFSPSDSKSVASSVFYGEEDRISYRRSYTARHVLSVSCISMES